MDKLSLFIWVPMITMLIIAFLNDPKKVRIVAASGMALQLLQAIWLLISFLAERKAGNINEMVFTRDSIWYESLNIHFAVGVDGVSVALILLTAIIIFVGVFASWEMEVRPKEFFISLILLATGVFAPALYFGELVAAPESCSRFLHSRQ